jgi:hypothetical protein
MSDESLIATPGRTPGTVRLPSGEERAVPAGWVLVPPGDPALTRRVKAGGATWTVQEKRGRKLFSRGVWAPHERVEAVKEALELERADPSYAKKLDAGRRRREREQASYVEEFEASVREYLAFHPRHAEMAKALARAVTEHATPVGSGTVARTERIPVEQRAEAAVIAWMRHRTTAYDSMHVPRVAGARREVRRELAQRSKALLGRYRRGEDVDAATCPLARALSFGGVVPTPPPVGSESRHPSPNPSVLRAYGFDPERP